MTEIGTQELCPAVFGAHDWHWFDIPSLIGFVLGNPEPVCASYDRICRRCMLEQSFEVPHG